MDKTLVVVVFFLNKIIYQILYTLYKTPHCQTLSFLCLCRYIDPSLCHSLREALDYVISYLLNLFCRTGV